MSAIEDRNSHGLRDRSVGELLRQLSRQTGTLIHQEVELAKAEATAKATSFGAAGALLAAAAIAAIFALALLTTTLVLALALGMAAWASALILTMVWVVAAVALALWGRQRLRRAGNPVPEMTIETLKEDLQWLKSRK